MISPNCQRFMKISFTLFTILNLILISELYLSQFGEVSDNYLLIIFWILIINIFIIFFLQLKVSNFENKFDIALILIELIIVNFTLHSIYQLPFQKPFGTDAASEMFVIKYSILSNNHVNFNLNEYSPWPVLHIYGSILYYYTNFSLEQIIKYAPIFINLSIPLLLYITFKKILGEDFNPKVILLSILFVITINNYILFGSTFIRQTIAVPILLMTIYFFYARNDFEGNNYKIMTILFIISLILLTMSHHFSSLIIMILLTTLVIYDSYSNKIKIKSNKKSRNFLILTSVIIMAYWAFVALLPLMTFGKFLTNLIDPVGSSYSETAKIGLNNIYNIRGYIIYIGFYIFNILFSIILILRYKYIKKVFGFALFLFIIGGIGFLGLYITSIKIAPDRLLLFGWIFGSLPLILAISKIKKNNIRKICISIVFVFMIFNVFQIDPTIYTEPSKYISHETFEDHASLDIIKPSSKILGYSSQENILINQNKTIQFDTLTLSNMKKIENGLNKNRYDFILKNQIYDKKISEDNTLKYGYGNYTNFIKKININSNYSKISDSGNLQIYFNIL